MDDMIINNNRVSNPDVVINTDSLTKRYGNFVAVDGLNLSINRGEVFGMLGPNGSGKTTTILMLLGLTEPSGGSVRILGYDPVRRPLQVKARVGYLPDQIGFYDDLSARENLIYIAKLNGISRSEGYRRIDEALARMGLAHAARQPVRTYSRGMRQRLGVAELLIKQPSIIILDEPTLGLDPEAARNFLTVIQDLKQEGITVLLSSHLLYQVQEVCDRVGLFNRGKMLLEGTVPALARQVLGSGYRVHVNAQGDADELRHVLATVPGATDVVQEGPRRFVVEAAGDVRADVAQAVVGAGARLTELDIEEHNLEEIYSTYFREVEHGATS